MYAYFIGNITEIEEDNCIIEVGHIGYNLKISSLTAMKLSEKREAIKVYTYTCVREDAFLLYGFLSKNELDVFKKCITVNGIGPKGALGLLSVLEADELRIAICSEDVKAIAKAPGIGKKTAERLILDLKDKIGLDEAILGLDHGNANKSNSSNNIEKQEAIEALVSLGYIQSDCIKIVNQIPDGENMDSAQLVKLALKKLF